MYIADGCGWATEYGLGCHVAVSNRLVNLLRKHSDSLDPEDAPNLDAALLRTISSTP